MFFIKKISASDCSYIVLIFRAISASMFLLSLFLVKKEGHETVRILSWWPMLTSGIRYAEQSG